MEISWLESIIYGFVAGLAEIMPVSSVAHQSLMQSLFGVTENIPVLRLSVTIGTLIGVLFSMWPLYSRIRKEYQIGNSRRRRRPKPVNMQYVRDWNMIKVALVPLLLGGLLYVKISHWMDMVPLICLFLAINGLILHIPMYFAKGNKDSRSMSGLDALLLGLVSVLGYLPGVSRMAAGLSLASLRGADGQQGVKWGLLLSAPALAVILSLDGYRVITSDTGNMESAFLLKCFLVAAAACAGLCIGIRMLKKFLIRSTPESLSFYCWGVTLFSFIIYLY